MSGEVQPAKLAERVLGHQLSQPLLARVAAQQQLRFRDSCSVIGGDAWSSKRVPGNRALELDPICHGTPILASDLADYLAPALDDELTGVFHIAGAERVSPYQFAKQLASAFELGTPASRTIRELAARPTGFGRGEASLQTRRFRTEYDCSMPMLSEGLARLVEQHRSGGRDRLAGQSTRPSKAA